MTIEKSTNKHPITATDPSNGLSGGCGPDRAPSWSREKLHQLAFQRRSEGGSSYLAMKMPGGRWVAKYHFEEAHELFWRNADRLKLNRKHQAKALCSTPAWADWPRGQQIAMGRCIKYFADHGVLPITLANPQKKSGPWKYFLRAEAVGSINIH